MINQQSVLVKTVFCLIAISVCIACNSGGSSSTFSPSDTLFLDAANSGENPVNAGEAFVFGVAELFSNDPVAVIETSIVEQGETSSLDILHTGSSITPSRHASGLVTVTEPCLINGIQYRQISVLTEDGGTSTLTPCSNQIESPSGFTWIDYGQLSPNGQRLAAQLLSSGEPPISVVYESGQEILRYSGFGRPTWLNDDELVMVGSTLVTARLGEQPIIINEAVTELSNGAVAVSPDGSKLVFEWGNALWLMNADGSGLRELLPANRYIFPAWSPDGRWIATMQQETPSAFEIQVGAIDGFFIFTNLSTFTVVNVEDGRLFTHDVSTHLGDSQMPQGGLSWK